MIENFKKIIKGFYADSLYKNSFYLILSNILNGLLGFIFLMIATHLYSLYDVGIYSVLFSATSLIILFSMTSGFSVALIRIIPSAPPLEKNEIVSSFLAISCVTVLIISFIFVFCIEVFSSKLIFLKENLFYGFIFILFAIFSAASAILSGAFVAFNNTKYHFIICTTTSIGRIVLLPFLISFLYIGIFYSAGIGTFFGVIISLFLLYRVKIFKLNIINFNVIAKRVKKNFDYIFINYLLSIMSLLFNLLLPIFILNIFSAEIAAYFYIAWTLFSLIIGVVVSITTSFFVEGSYNKGEIKKSKNKALKCSLIIATICIFGVFLFGRFILSLFGDAYLNSLELLYIFTISIYFFVINDIYLTELLIKKKMGEVLILKFLITISAIMFGIFLMYLFGVIGAGYGWLIGQLIGIIWILLRFVFNRLFV